MIDRHSLKFTRINRDLKKVVEKNSRNAVGITNKDKDINSNREKSLILNEFLTVIALCETKLENIHYLHSVMVNKLVSESFCWFNKLDSHLLLYKYGLVSY